jgi:hypothetical protein
VASGYVTDRDRQFRWNPELGEPAVEGFTKVCNGRLRRLALTVRPAARQRRVGAPPSSLVNFNGIRYVRDTIHAGIVPKPSRGAIAAGSLRVRRLGTTSVVRTRGELSAVMAISLVA